MKFISVEHALQYAKSNDPAYQALILNCATPMEAWKLGQTCVLRPDWEQCKQKRMYDAVSAKFFQNPRLRTMLIQSNPHKITFQHGNVKDAWDQTNEDAIMFIRAVLISREEMNHNAANETNQS